MRVCSHEAYDEESCKILRYSHQRCYNSPCYCQSGKPEFGRCPLKDDVARELEQNVAEEVKRQTSEILIAGHLQVGRQPLNTSICDYKSQWAIEN
jgi:hypothetical protein